MFKKKKVSNFYQIRNCTFAYKCKADWESLEDTGEEKVRYCRDCEKTVHLCENDADLNEAIREDLCVASERFEKRRFEVLLGLIRKIDQ